MTRVPASSGLGPPEGRSAGGRSSASSWPTRIPPNSRWLSVRPSESEARISPKPESGSSWDWLELQEGKKSFKVRLGSRLIQKSHRRLYFCHSFDVPLWLKFVILLQFYSIFWWGRTCIKKWKLNLYLWVFLYLKSESRADENTDSPAHNSDQFPINSTETMS